MYGLSTPLIGFISCNMDIVLGAFDISIDLNRDHLDLLVKKKVFLL